jgi:hypothetical protein
MKVTLKSGILVDFLNVYGYKVMISTFLLTDVVDYFSFIFLGPSSESALPENESELRYRGDWSNAGQFSFFSHISQYNHYFFFTFLCISHLPPPIFFI